MNPRLRTAVVLVAIAVAAYLGYRWYENRSSSGSAGAGVVTADVGGSSGPGSGLNYYAGATNVDITESVTGGKNDTTSTDNQDSDGKKKKKTGGGSTGKWKAPKVIGGNYYHGKKK